MTSQDHNNLDAVALQALTVCLKTYLRRSILKYGKYRQPRIIAKSVQCLLLLHYYNCLFKFVMARLK